MTRRRTFMALVATVALTVAGAVFAALPASAASLQQITNFGTNPSNISMFLYVPTNVAARPAIVVGVHWCHGTAQDFYSGTQYAALADRYGFIVIYPSASSSDGCWDVHSQAALTHNGGSDPQGIVSMVQYVEQHYNGDPNRVYATGHSSGGMMTNVLLGSYPDVFKAGAAFAGVPFGCFAGTDSWSTACATGTITKTAQQWGDLVRAAYPGYTGTRPRMQLWHGTADDTLNFHNFGEEIKQWTNVLGVSQTPTSTENNALQSGWIRTRYGIQVEAIQETGQPHNLQIVADQAIHFFGLDSTTTSPTAAPSSSGTGSGSGALVEGFESGRNGWSAGGVSGGPWQVNEWAAQGSYSLKADVALGSGKSYSLSKVATQSLASGSTLKATVRAATWGTLGSGVTAKIYVKSGSSYAWYDSGVTTITTGTGGTTLSLNLSAVANRSDVREIGVQFFAASNSSGTTSIYLDNVTVA